MPDSTTTSRPVSGHHSLAPRTSSGGSPSTGHAALDGPRRPPAAVRYPDVLLVVLATPVALVLAAPALGYLIGAGAWVLQRILAEANQRWLRGAAERRFGLTLFEAFGRIWLLAGAIVVAGVAGGRADGLTAAVTIFVAYSVAFAARLVDGRPSGAPQR